MIRVVIGDENQQSCDQLATEINRDLGIVVLACAYDVDTLIRQVDQHQPDIVVLDFMDPLDLGLKTIEHLLKSYPALEVLVTAQIAEDSFVTKLIDIGVAYYLMKPFKTEDLISRIRYVDRYYSNSFDVFYFHNKQIILQYLTNQFASIGIPASFKGYRYLLDAIMLVSQDNAWLNGVTRGLYPTVARANRTTASHVERSIRYALETAWSRGDLEYLQDLFPYTISPDKGKPTNTAFIATMADLVNISFTLTE